MQPQQFERKRIRMLEDRMRRPSKPLNNQESLKTIKSTDSKKMIMPVQQNKKKQDAEEEWKGDKAQHIKQSQEQIKVNCKTTDFFKVVKKDPKSSSVREEPASPKHTQLIQQVEQPMSKQIFRSPSPTRSKGAGEDTARDEIQGLKDTLKEKDLKLISLQKEFHLAKQRERLQKIQNNNVRLGEFVKGGWIDGVKMVSCKKKIEEVEKKKKQKEQEQKLAKKNMNMEEQWNTPWCTQIFFLSRQELHFKKHLEILQEQREAHRMESSFMQMELNSKYGKDLPKINHYQLLGLLGKGGYGQVYKAFDIKLLREVVVKVPIIPSTFSKMKQENILKSAIKEHQIHKMLSHPNIVRSYDTVEIDSNSFCTVLEYCDGPDLSYYLKKHKKIPERQAKLIIRQVASAIRYLHELQNKVIHHDLKPQNILFHKGRVKITDFGLSIVTQKDSILLQQNNGGTCWYLPPECFSINKRQKRKITPRVDVWSIGVIYFEMLYGEKPFGEGKSQAQIIKEGIIISAAKVLFPEQQKDAISKESKEFIEECLKYQVENRLTSKGVTEHRLFRPK